jgi:hypothetical protein
MFVWTRDRLHPASLQRNARVHYSRGLGRVEATYVVSRRDEVLLTWTKVILASLGLLLALYGVGMLIELIGRAAGNS